MLRVLRPLPGGDGPGLPEGEQDRSREAMTKSGGLSNGGYLVKGEACRPGDDFGGGPPRSASAWPPSRTLRICRIPPSCCPPAFSGHQKTCPSAGRPHRLPAFCGFSLRSAATFPIPPMPWHWPSSRSSRPPRWHAAPVRPGRAPCRVPASPSCRQWWLRRAPG